MNARQVSGRCPVCQGEMVIEVLACTQCGSKLSGQFQLSKLCSLSRDQLSFVEVFVRNRGNIKEIEKALGISYPTVRGKLDEVIAALGDADDAHSHDKLEVLRRLESGEISQAEAIEKLKNGRK